MIRILPFCTPSKPRRLSFIPLSLFVFHLLLYLTGCATTSDLDAVRNNLANIQSEVNSQRRDMADLKIALSEINKDVSALKDRTEGVVKEYSLIAIRESLSTILSQTSDLSKELQTLKGRFEENKYFMDKTVKEHLSEREVILAKINALENEIKEAKSKLALLSITLEKIEKREQSQETPKVQEKKPESESNDPTKLYDNAELAFNEKRYEEARILSDRLIKEFPNHSSIPKAYFLIGEAYYAEKKYEDAILAYEAFLKKYPTHEKVKTAKLKQAYSFIELGDKKTGKVLLEKIIDGYPDSSEARLAKKKISEISQKPASPPAKKR